MPRIIKTEIIPIKFVFYLVHRGKAFFKRPEESNFNLPG